MVIKSLQTSWLITLKSTVALGAPLREEHATIGDLVDNTTRLNPDNAAAKITGKLPMLPSNVQEQVYTMIESEYKLYLEQLDAMGENDLEAKNIYKQMQSPEIRIKIFRGHRHIPI